MIDPGIAVCPSCMRDSAPLSAAVGVCGDCLRKGVAYAMESCGSAHASSRAEFGLPPAVPRSPGGIHCPLCSNECVIGEGEKGFCGLRTVRKGKLVHTAGTPSRGLLSWYRDPLPANCVAAWVCGGSSHRGYHNLAVCYESCTADCLFCQNWQFRSTSPGTGRTTGAEELSAEANAQTYCVCYFGGDPASQMPHALASARLLARRGIRVCWETNGMMSTKFLDLAVGHCIESGGCIKFDLKAFDENVHMGLTCVSNRRPLENFARAVKRFDERAEPPLVVASTLLVPGYVDADEVSAIAAYIASLDSRIPYALLAFGPNYLMSDLPRTPALQARRAEDAARAAGLVNVRVGNRHLLA